MDTCWSRSPRYFGQNPALLEIGISRARLSFSFLYEIWIYFLHNLFGIEACLHSSRNFCLYTRHARLSSWLTHWAFCAMVGEIRPLWLNECFEDVQRGALVAGRKMMGLSCSFSLLWFFGAIIFWMGIRPWRMWCRRFCILHDDGEHSTFSFSTDWIFIFSFERLCEAGL